MANYQTAVKEATSAYFSDIISNNNPNPKRKEEKRETEKKERLSALFLEMYIEMIVQRSLMLIVLEGKNIKFK